MKVSHSLDDNGILEIVLSNQERRNSLDDEMILEIIGNLRRHSRLTIIRSVGQYFCSGRDISGIDPDDDRSMQPLEELALAFRGSRQPILTVVEGWAIGLGVSLACWGDLCLSSTEAKFMIPESKIGIAPTITANSVLEIIGRKRCLDMCLTGREITAAQAHEYGIVQYLSPPERVNDVKTDISERILHAAPDAIALSKSLINSLDEETFRRNLEQSARQALISARTDTARDGLKAFREKKKPSWVPREYK